MHEHKCACGKHKCCSEVVSVFDLFPKLQMQFSNDLGDSSEEDDFERLAELYLKDDGLIDNAIAKSVGECDPDDAEQLKNDFRCYIEKRLYLAQFPRDVVKGFLEKNGNVLSPDCEFVDHRVKEALAVLEKAIDANEIPWDLEERFYSEGGIFESLWTDIESETLEGQLRRGLEIVALEGMLDEVCECISCLDEETAKGMAGLNFNDMDEDCLPQSTERHT